MFFKVSFLSSKELSRMVAIQVLYSVALTVSIVGGLAYFDANTGDERAELLGLFAMIFFPAVSSGIFKLYTNLRSSIIITDAELLVCGRKIDRFETRSLKKIKVRKFPKFMTAFFPSLKKYGFVTLYRKRVFSYPILLKADEFNIANSFAQSLSKRLNISMS